MAFNFESLKIWHLSPELTDEIDMLAQTFPKHEIYSLSSQIRRAANSVSLNIVEGSTGLTNAEFKKISCNCQSFGIRSGWLLIFGKKKKVYF